MCNQDSEYPRRDTALHVLFNVSVSLGIKRNKTKQCPNLDVIDSEGGQVSQNKRAGHIHSGLVELIVYIDGVLGDSAIWV